MKWIIWRLGRKFKWIRTNYKKITKGKWLWGIMGAIEDYGCSDYENSDTNTEFDKHLQEMFDIT